MIKVNKILALGLGILSMLFINSCVEDDDFQTPDLTVPPVDVASLGSFSSFTNIISRYNTALSNGEQVGVFSVENDGPLYTIGYVVSDDTQGNFFEEVIIQNTPDAIDPSSDVRRGLKLEINARDLGGIYNFGRKVYIKLNGLAISESNGVYVLGRAEGNSLVQIEESEMDDFIVRDPETATITPKVVSVSTLTSFDENTYVQFNDIQFSKPLLSATYAGEPSDEFDGFRALESCADGDIMTLQTSTFSDFKNVQLAQGRGLINGIYTRDFGDDYDVLVVNTLADINFDDSVARCDPGLIGCQSNFGLTNEIFFEDFENFGNYASEGWTMTNVNGGNVDWFISGFGGNTYSRISAFNSGETDAEVWLVTPTIDLSQTTGEAFSFDLQANFDNGKGIVVYISDDFTGDVTTATWSTLQAFIPSGPSDGFANNFETIGPMNISCIDGNVNIAVVYKGSDPSITTRYHADNFRVTSE